MYPNFITEGISNSADTLRIFPRPFNIISALPPSTSDRALLVLHTFSGSKVTFKSNTGVLSLSTVPITAGSIAWHMDVANTPTV